MAFKKKPMKKKTAPKKAQPPKPAGVEATLFFRDPENPGPLFRLTTKCAMPAPGGGLDLSEIPEGGVHSYVGGEWVAAALPENARHTKNTAKVGV